jgi:hypothetical protein
MTTKFVTAKDCVRRHGLKREDFDSLFGTSIEVVARPTRPSIDCIWSILDDNDGGRAYIMAGIRRINNIGYIVTSNARVNDDFDQYPAYEF